MERLTIRNSEGIGVLKQPYQCERCGDLQWSLPDLGNGSPTDRLAEYEDIGLSPEQIKEVDRLYTEKCKELAELKKLKEYRHLEEEGKLLKLPCAVGDTVWYISEKTEKQGRKNIKVSFVEKGTVDNIIVGCAMVPQINVCNDENIWTTFDSVEDFGKTVFLTKEEAEAALKGLEGGKGK